MPALEVPDESHLSLARDMGLPPSFFDWYKETLANGHPLDYSYYDLETAGDASAVEALIDSYKLDHAAAAQALISLKAMDEIDDNLVRRVDSYIGDVQGLILNFRLIHQKITEPERTALELRNYYTEF